MASLNGDRTKITMESYLETLSHMMNAFTSEIDNDKVDVDYNDINSILSDLLKKRDVLNKFITLMKSFKEVIDNECVIDLSLANNESDL